jgi:hypothetical protein
VTFGQQPADATRSASSVRCWGAAADGSIFVAVFVDRFLHGTGPAAAAGRAAAIPAASAHLAAMSVVVAAQVGPDRLEHDVDVALDTKPRAQKGDVNLVRTEVMQDGRAAIEKGLDIDELPRPIPFLKDSLAEGKTTQSCLFGAARARQVIWPSYPEDAPRRGWHGWVQLGVGRPSRCVARTALGWPRAVLKSDEDFAQLNTAVGLDHNVLTARERRGARGRSGEPPDVAHDSVANQIRFFTHRTLAPPRLSRLPDCLRNTVILPMPFI